ncbi:hypothetical protein P152DRAFT_457675 [Eremomyces bilateralis CBS 781.70]|uniref:Uncharacterized protein n=1 Tax=Eremomyces bilateralis CBS 781.70 TaxID=1392243 RepID=A0A6G1G5I4_9PEZI|nr:uncharacterized protein P152DRAFT_457675 [Eremomyces bilateralis CBS 781.70]KAF1813314.1 hypothetical protein P152DRAFT_457675 [Eremomyces bilateralis CBS 781.70]
MPTEPLQERNANVPSPTKTHVEEKGQPVVQQNAAKAQFANNNRFSKSYISPSDAVLSPATKKLAAFKNKHMTKGIKPQSLFGRSPPAEHTAEDRTADTRAAASSSIGFASIGQALNEPPK